VSQHEQTDNTPDTEPSQPVSHTVQPNAAPLPLAIPVKPVKKNQPNPHDVATRGLVLAWCLWLLGCWAVTLSMNSMIPPWRWMALSCLLGMMALWPVFRLSQDMIVNEPRYGGVAGMTPGMVWTDWLCLVLVFQAVVWPLRIMSQWSVAQTVMIDLHVIVWSLLSGAVVAVGCGYRSGGPRAAAMLMGIFILIGEPLFRGILSVFDLQGAQPQWSMQWTPIQSLWEMTASTTHWQNEQWTPQIAAVFIAAILAWILAWRWRRRMALGL